MQGVLGIVGSQAEVPRLGVDDDRGDHKVQTVAAEVDDARLPRVLFTAPWDPPVVRRGDALGLRALTDQFADAVAPGLSNRVRDGRWVTILSWCLARSQEVFHARGGRSVQTREQHVAGHAHVAGNALATASKRKAKMRVSSRSTITACAMSPSGPSGSS